MRTTIRWMVIAVLGLLLSSGVVRGQETAGTAFTYQGQLEHLGTPVTATCDLEFSLWAEPSGQTQVGTTRVASDVAVDKGLFAAQLDFGAGVFGGDARWLKIAVRCAGDLDFTDLAPLQPLTPAPHALHAQTLDHDAVTTQTIQDGTILFGDLDQNAATPGQVMKWTGSAWAPADDFGVPGPLTAVWGADGLAGGGDHDAVTVTLADLGVTSNKLADGAVAAGKIAPEAVTAGTLAADAVTSGTIASGAVTPGTIASNAVTAPAIAASAITAGKIASDAVIAGTVAAAAIDSEAIENGAVATQDIADDAITSGKIGPGEVGATDLADDAVSSAKIADAQIGTSHLVDDAITAGKIADAQIGTSHLVDDAITAGKIADAQIGTAHLVDDAVTTAHIVDGTIGLGDIAQNGASDGQTLKWDSGLPGWAPAEDETGTSSVGWVDDGATVRLETATDSVGIGTATPQETLDVAGRVRVEGLVMPVGAGAGRVLTSDVGGTASWQAPAPGEESARTPIYQVFRHTETLSGTVSNHPLGPAIHPGQARYITGIWVRGNSDATDVEARFDTSGGPDPSVIFIATQDTSSPAGFWSSGGGAPIALTEGSSLELALTFTGGDGGPGRVHVTLTGYNRPSLPPYASRPTGPDQGTIDQTIWLNAEIAEPEDDQFYYQWDWDDGETSAWTKATGPSATGNHAWAVEGLYFVRVRAKDEYGQASDWSAALAVEIQGGGP